MRTEVDTENSRYVLDDESRTVTRVSTDTRAMRRDSEAIEYVEVAEPTIGKPWRMVLRLRADGVLTYRETSYVVRVAEACAWCGEFNMDEMRCPNAKDICTDCCGED